LNSRTPEEPGQPGRFRRPSRLALRLTAASLLVALAALFAVLATTAQVVRESAVASIFADLDGGPSYWFIQPLSAMAKPMTTSSSAWRGVATPRDRASAAAPASHVNLPIVVSSLNAPKVASCGAISPRQCGIRRQL